MAKNKKFEHLKNKFDAYHKNALTTLKDTHLKPVLKAKNHAVGMVGGVALATGIAGGAGIAVTTADQIVELKHDANKDNRKQTDQNVFNTSIQLLNSDPNNLTSVDEVKVEKALSDYYGLDLKVTLEGNRLNENWGYFGQEQHLYRWPGDSIEKHGLQKYGIAPNTGAFGYFENARQEEYYIAAPIHLLPNWNTHWPTLKPWYKFRKVLVYNPKTNKAVVAVVGDAGPAKFTGKQFGGSPEVMNYLQMVDGAQKSRAVVLFVDEKEKKVPLGPVDPKQKDLIANLPK